MSRLNVIDVFLSFGYKDFTKMEFTVDFGFVHFIVWATSSLSLLC